MRATHILGFAGLGLLAGIASIIARKRPATSSMLLVGDSLGIGLAIPLRALRLPLQSISVAGTTIDYWTTIGKPQLQAALRPSISVVFVSLGANDAYAGADDASIAAAATRQLLSVLLAANVQVFWIGPPKLPASYGGKTMSQSIVDAIRQVVETTNGAMWIDDSKFNLPRQEDQLHPTVAGNLAWANLLVDELAQFFVAPGPSEVGNDENRIGD